MPRQDPYRQFRFRIEIDGITQAGFSECSFADTTTDPVEYREGDEPTVFRKLSGLTKYGNITLKWGITDSMDIYNKEEYVDYSRR
jgi:phage tail-like protein